MAGSATVAVAVVAGVVLAGTNPAVSAAAAASGAFPVTADTAGSETAAVSASWAQVHYGPDRTGYQPNETIIGTNDVATMALARTYSAGAGGASAPLIASNVLYTDIAGYLYAFSASGSSGCSGTPTECMPLWEAPTSQFDGMAVANGVVYVTDAEGVQAFDAAGSINCSGTPKLCNPLWATSTHTFTGPNFTPDGGSPVVSNGFLYVPGYGDGLPLTSGGAYVSAFDASGVSHCSGSPKICTPIWTTTGLPSSAGNVGSPTVANGFLYIGNGTLYAFDAAGVSNCSGTVTVCSPLWTAATLSGPTYAAPSVANGVVYLGSWYGPLYAFDAAGLKNCATSGGIKGCTPLWTAATTGGIGGIPAEAYGHVYVVSTDGNLAVFDAAGVTKCSGASTARTCLPLWTSGPGGTGYVTSSSPAVANGLVYFSSTNGGTYAYDAAGVRGCTTSGTTKKCGSLWGAVSGYIGGGSPAVVNGIVYVNMTAVSAVLAYHTVPTKPSKPTGVKAISGSTTTSTGSLTVTYALGTDNGSTITSQTASCLSSNGGTARTAAHTGSTAAPITVGSLTTGKTYACTVTATNAKGTSSASSASLPVTVGSPAAPTSISLAHPAAGQLTISFTPAANNGSAITSFTATCVSSNSGITKSKAGAVSPLTVSGLTAGKSYTCTVVALNSRGAGLASTPSAAATA